MLLNVLRCVCVNIWEATEVVKVNVGVCVLSETGRGEPPDAEGMW